ncbi:aminoacylase-1 isoform X2 [Gossypium hirsutum]|uniref:N-acyl-aliphatic-L-amino acid amidohydrolase n=1 Tax=Gossypium hirsutum TaxID=3635 RepID=A0A1U8KXY9_GOSHI|nr:aminoacylase-1 isoform X2 [Gossypium hirsutum]
MEKLCNFNHEFIIVHLLLFSSLLSFTNPTPSPTQDEQSQIISRFQEYLRINTSQPSPDYKKSTQFILTLAESLSLQTQVIEFVQGKPLVILKWPGFDLSLPSILLNSHTDVVPSESSKWDYHPFGAHIDENGNIFARGSQDMKCVGMQYMEAVRRLKASGFQPKRSLYLSFVPDEEIGGHDGLEKLAQSDVFKSMDVDIILDEGLASPNENYRLFYGERTPWWLVIKATGAPGHGAKLYDNSAMENLFKSIESIRRFRASQFDLVKAGLKGEGEVISVNMAFLKAGTPSPTFKQKGSTQDYWGRPLITATDRSNPWWALLVEAIKKANGKIGKPEIFPAATDSRYFRQQGLRAIGFSPMANTPVLLHDHNEFLNQAEYLKGIDVYESMIKAYTSYIPPGRDSLSRDEL